MMSRAGSWLSYPLRSSCVWHLGVRNPAVGGVPASRADVNAPHLHGQVPDEVGDAQRKNPEWAASEQQICPLGQQMEIPLANVQTWVGQQAPLRQVCPLGQQMPPQ
jgi:hypothetical protein